MSLPVLPPDAAEPPGSACEGCSRRALLRGLGAALAGTLVVSACGSDQQAMVDGGPPPPDAPAGSCPTGDLCLDTTKSPYTVLATTGGSVIVSTRRDQLVVVRTSATTVAALSAICTHQGCTVTYENGPKLLLCPCHGSEFSLTGSVIRGPAFTALESYSATLSGTVITITGV